MIKDDIIEAVIGLGPNLFYNSPMEACLLVCRWNKPTERKGKILFINAVKEVTRQNASSFLEDSHIEKIYKAYKDFKNIPGLAKIVADSTILTNNSNLNIPLYVSGTNNGNGEKKIHDVVGAWLNTSSELKQSTKKLLDTLESKKL